MVGKRMTNDVFIAWWCVKQYFIIFQKYYIKYSSGHLLVTVKIHDQCCQEMHKLFAKKTEDMNEDNNIVITEHLHLVCDGLPVGEDVAEVAGPQHVPQRGGRQQPGRAAVVVHVGHGVDSVLNLVVHDGVHKHRHAVLGQDLQSW